MYLSSDMARREFKSEWIHRYTNRILTAHTENCEGWLSPGGHSSGGRALSA